MSNVDWLYDEDELRVICPDCGEPCVVIATDEGFPFEFGSQKGWHSMMSYETACCGVPLSKNHLL